VYWWLAAALVAFALVSFRRLTGKISIACRLLDELPGRLDLSPPSGP
jgi:hypothetical protein